jgi:hypothetical protein
VRLQSTTSVGTPVSAMTLIGNDTRRFSSTSFGTGGGGTPYQFGMSPTDQFDVDQQYFRKIVSNAQRYEEQNFFQEQQKSVL